MFRAIGRWFRSLGYFLTGRVDSSRRTLDSDPQAMRAQYEAVIREKTGRIHQYKQAVAGLIAQQENKLDKIKTLNGEVEKLETLKTGALAKAQQRVKALKGSGADKDAIHGDEEYQKCLMAFNDFSSSLEEKLKRIAEHEGEVAEYGGRIKEHKLQLQELVREIEKLKSETHDAVADVISAKQEKELNDALAGIGEDTTDARLAELRQTRQELRAEARVSKELAGTDTRLQEAEFLEYARTHAKNDEFDKLIGLADSAEAGGNEAASGDSETSGKLPE